MTMTVILAILWGAFVGLTLGLLGGGGGLLAMPVLLYAFQIPLRTTIATSLFLVMLGALPAVILYLKKGDVDLKAALPLGVGGALGASLSSRLSGFFSGDFLLTFLLVMMGLSAFYMLQPRKTSAAATGSPEEAQTLEADPPAGLLALGLVGFGIGIVTGLLGVSGGFLLVPSLLLFAKVEPRRAIATSLGIISVNACFGALGYADILPFGDILFWGLASGMLLGSLTGFRLSYRVPQAKLRQGFGMLLIVLMGLMIVFPPPR